MLKGDFTSYLTRAFKNFGWDGHGDTLVLENCNYPAVSTGKRYIRADGVKATNFIKRDNAIIIIGC